ncbi:hypothetical protein JXB28_00985 [Candidatus Woesearchaeota archaeon]|nr:hypothetical protein [Candidatus Woesearchaeota archaeon]
MGLEEKTKEQFLKPGIVKEIQGVTIPAFPDHSSEIKEYRKEAKKENLQLPFVNQDKALLQLARTLSTSYPYAVLIGESGIGKSMVLDYVVKVLTGKVSLDEVEKVIPEAAPLLKKVKENTSRFEHRKYLSVPNLQDPFNVNTIAYTEPEELEEDINTALSFCNEVGNMLKHYTRFNQDDIRVVMKEEDFRKAIRSKIHSTYIDILEQLYKNMKLEKKKDSMESEPVALLYFEMPEKLFGDRKKIKTRVEIIGEERARKGKAKTASQKRLRQEYGLVMYKKEIMQEASDMMIELLYKVSTTDIHHKPKNEKERIVKEELEDYMENVAGPIYSQCIKGKIRNQQLLLAKLLPKVRSYHGERRISGNTIGEIIDALDDFKKEYTSVARHEQLKSWMESVVDYFKSERKVIEDNLVEMLKFDERENVRLRSELRKKRQEEALKRLADKLLGKDEKKQKPTPEPKPKENPLERRYWSDFKVPHGNARIDVGRVLTVFEQGYEFPTRKGVTWTKLGDFDAETLFGQFNTIEDDDDINDDARIPPHHTIMRLGPFFKSGLVIFNDSFKKFIKAITSDYTDNQGMKEQFLEYLQTGVLTVINGDISYRFDAPKIIIGCDNEDPFEITDGTIFVRDEVGFRGRIKSISVPDLATNNKEARKGSIRVLYEALEKYVKNSIGTGKPGDAITVTDQAASMLLQRTMMSERLLSLEYRQFSTKIEELCAYAMSKGVKAITPELLREHIKDQIPPYFFYYVDREQEFDGYFSLPKSQPGHVHGLSVFHNAPAEIGKIKSYFKPGIEDNNHNTKHFELIDIESQMTDETAIKGYELAKDLVTKIIAGAQGKGKLVLAGRDWQIKTHFDGNYEGIGGPSASLAIAMSMVSALADEPVYRNRFVTGTIEPSSFKVGEIGGTYYKGLIPMRIKELLDTKGEDEDAYFLFPATNMKDLTRDVIFDPFGLEQKVVCLPITTFQQAYHLLTCGPRISIDDFKNAQKKGEEKLEQTLQKIYEKFNGCKD